MNTHTIPNLTNIVRDAFRAAPGKIIVDYGPSTQYHHRTHLWLDRVSSPIPCLPARQAVKAWASELRGLGLNILRLQASIPTQWQQDLVEPLLADDIVALIDHVARTAFESGSMRRRPYLDLVLTSEAEGEEGITPLGGIPAMSDKERNRVMDIMATCHRWQVDNRDWLLQHTSRIDLLINIPNPHFRDAIRGTI